MTDSFKDLPKRTLTALYEAGIEDLETLCVLKPSDIADIKGIGGKSLKAVLALYEANVAAPSKRDGEKRSRTPAPVREGPPPVEFVDKTVRLKKRHADWVERAAKAYGQTEQQIMEQAILMVYQRDPYKARDFDPVKGQGGTIRREDFDATTKRR